MPYRILVPLLLGSWACSPNDPSDAPDTDAAGSDEDTRTFPTLLGGDRPAPVVAPEAFDPAEPLPAIVLLHGFTVTADLQDALFQLRARVDDAGFLLVMPEGTVDDNGAQFWDAAEECCGRSGPDVDDVAYLSGLIDELRAGWNVSTVALVGHSNGGYMAYRMACDAPDLVDRMVVLAGSEPVEPRDCVDGAPTALLHIHGTVDDDVPYDAAPSPFATPGARASVARQAARNGCGDTTEALGTADLVTRVDGAESRGEAYVDCEASTTLWTVEDGRHWFLTVTEAFRDGVAAFALGQETTFSE